MQPCGLGADDQLIPRGRSRNSAPSPCVDGVAGHLLASTGLRAGWPWLGVGKTLIEVSIVVDRCPCAIGAWPLIPPNAERDSGGDGTGQTRQHDHCPATGRPDARALDWTRRCDARAAPGRWPAVAAGFPAAVGRGRALARPATPWPWSRCRCWRLRSCIRGLPGGDVTIVYLRLRLVPASGAQRPASTYTD